MFELLEITWSACAKMADSGEVIVVFRDVSRRKWASGPSASKTSRTDEETEHLISLWNGEDVLFNCRNKDYFKKDARHVETCRAWTKKVRIFNF